MSEDSTKVPVTYSDWGFVEYGEAWERQEELLRQNLEIKSLNRKAEEKGQPLQLSLQNFILCTHPHVYTLGKSGIIENLLLSNEKMKELGVSFYKTNRGGDITYHGPGQIVGYPNLDLEQFYTDIGRYMRMLEQIIIDVLAQYQIKGDRDPEATGVWLDVGTPDARKICAMGVKTSRWVTMHGFALNVNTDLQFFNNIIPCGIQDKGVTSMEKELGKELDLEEIKTKIKLAFENNFGAILV